MVPSNEGKPYAHNSGTGSIPPLAGINCFPAKWACSSSEPVEQLLTDFNRWFAAQGPTVAHIQAALLPGWRIGTVCTHNLELGDTYLGVPDSAIMSAKKANIPDDSDSRGGVASLVRAMVERYGNERGHDDLHELLFFFSLSVSL